MNPLEAQLVYPFADELPAPGSVRAVAPGVEWLRMPLPFALDHINLWLLRDEREGRSGYTVIDCGVATDATRANWEQVLAGPMAGAPVSFRTSAWKAPVPKAFYRIPGASIRCAPSPMAPGRTTGPQTGSWLSARAFNIPK